MEIVETLLPGVGVRFEFTTRSGAPIAIVARRDGVFDVVVYDRDDLDESREVVQLDEQEATAVAEILGAPRLAETFADLNREVPGLASARIELPQGSPYDGRTLGDTGARTRTGASIVALVRGADVIASPGPDQPLHADDVLVAIGTNDGLERLRAILVGS